MEKPWPKLRKGLSPFPTSETLDNNKLVQGRNNLNFLRKTHGQKSILGEELKKKRALK